MLDEARGSAVASVQKGATHRCLLNCVFTLSGGPPWTRTTYLRVISTALYLMS